MAMKMECRLKGSLAQAVVKAVFSHWQFRVIPFGIEETIREIVALDEKKYLEVRLPQIMRKMPDYVVASIDMQHVRLVEVKYRYEWTRENRRKLCEDLRDQAKHWGEIIVVFVFAKFLEEGPCVKCLHLKAVTGDSPLEIIAATGSKDWNDVQESDFKELSELYPEVATDTPEFRNALRAIVSAEKGLASDRRKPKSAQSEPSISPDIVATPPDPNSTPPADSIVKSPFFPIVPVIRPPCEAGSDFSTARTEHAC